MNWKKNVNKFHLS